MPIRRLNEKKSKDYWKPREGILRFQRTALGVDCGDDRSPPAEHQKLLRCLVEGNQIRSKRTSLLMLTVAKIHFDHNGQADLPAYHDVGLAVGNLVVQATAMDLAVHQMAGILPDNIRECYAFPTGFEAVTGIAIGDQGDPKILPDRLRDQELASRPGTR